MAETQLNIVPNFEAICREAAGMRVACELGLHTTETEINDLANDLTDVSIELDNDDAMEVILDCMQRLKECPENAEPVLCGLVAIFLVASARQQAANVTEGRQL